MSVHIPKVLMVFVAFAPLFGSHAAGLAVGTQAPSTAQEDAFPALPGDSPSVIAIWGGYVATDDARTFTTASASWIIPKVTCLKDKDFYAPWVGIDGDGSPTVEQTGVATDCHTGVPRNRAWYEMYPARVVYYPDPVSPGDTFTASVVFSGGRFTLNIRDLTKDWTESTVQSRKSAKRLSAEAVIEAPGGYPAISRVKFTGVEFNGQPLTNFDLTKLSTQKGSRTIYTPSKIRNGTDFTIRPRR